ncbi:unnamed protein product [Onchocerca flexuosa]|uniref:Uncharacterized protein n=1 Tax=Onchocerca flexuosa TaxID=387005 RepID=A0A183H890_9BILA|nr:unnamed protein product [Onchocerca flexuosa]
MKTIAELQSSSTSPKYSKYSETELFDTRWKWRCSINCKGL